MDASSNFEETGIESDSKTQKAFPNSADETIELLQSINQQLEDITKLLTENELLTYCKKLHNPHRLFWRNFGIGIARGLGMTIGLTLVATILVFCLKSFVSLPIIGDFIAEIVRVVQNELVTLP